LVKEMVPTLDTGKEEAVIGAFRRLGRPPKSTQRPTKFRRASWSQRKTRREGNEQSAPHLKKQHPSHRQTDPRLHGDQQQRHICEIGFVKRVNHVLTTTRRVYSSSHPAHRLVAVNQESRKNGRTLIPLDGRPISPMSGPSEPWGPDSA
jgi:hypothetical protein